MALGEKQVKDRVKEMLGFRDREMFRLELIHSYLHSDLSYRKAGPSTGFGVDQGPLWWLASDVPNEVRRLAQISRVDFLERTVNAIAQQMYVDGYRRPRDAQDAAGWAIWQANGMDARQIPVHRGALSYGASYVLVLPGEPAPVIRGASARKMTVVYGEDDDWPEFALERRRPRLDSKHSLYRLIDATSVYWVEVDGAQNVELIDTQEHGVGRVPVVRFTDAQDEEDEPLGQVERRIPIQDQINVTTFALLVAQHYGAFRQRYIIGWVGDTETETARASAQKIMAFADEDVKVGEFGQTDLRGFIESRQAALRYMASLSETPANELLGELVNLSADALAAVEKGSQRKLMAQQTVSGEAWERVLALAGQLGGLEPDPEAFVRWKDTEARSLSQTADALGKLAGMLGVPAQALWERIPGVTQQEIETWKALIAEGDSISQLTRLLERQADGQGDQGV